MCAATISAGVSVCAATLASADRQVSATATAKSTGMRRLRCWLRPERLAFTHMVSPVLVVLLLVMPPPIVSDSCAV
jgi:hypothetical protein